MSVSYIPESIKMRLWGKCGGRCEYEGCNEPLWLDSLTKAEFNTAYIAHIIADKPKGTRGDDKRSEELNSDISNLMLMCDEHHRLIDHGDKEGHPEDRLLEMKRLHEERIERLTSIHPDKKSHIILYGANIGEHSSQVSYEGASIAMVPRYYPAETIVIELSLKSSSFHDSEERYWDMEREHLQRKFNELVKLRLAHGDSQHFSIFAFAPQPLLIELGRLLSNIVPAEVFQRHKEPQSWSWQGHPDGFKYQVNEPDTNHKVVALNLSLSATINNSRISSVIEEEHSVWTMTIGNPNTDFLKSREQLQDFRVIFSSLLNRIKAQHGEDAKIHLFPAVPVSVAVEIGRIWNPKADLPIMIYDQNNENGGFVFTFEITCKEDYND